MKNKNVKMYKNEEKAQKMYISWRKNKDKRKYKMRILGEM